MVQRTHQQIKAPRRLRVSTYGLLLLLTLILPILFVLGYRLLIQNSQRARVERFDAREAMKGVLLAQLLPKADGGWIIGPVKQPAMVLDKDFKIQAMTVASHTVWLKSNIESNVFWGFSSTGGKGSEAKRINLFDETGTALNTPALESLEGKYLRVVQGGAFLIDDTGVLEFYGDDGQLRWQRDGLPQFLPAVITEPDATAVYLLAGQPPITVDLDGVVVTQAHLAPRKLGRPRVAGTLLISKSDSGDLLLLDREGRELWSGYPPYGFGLLSHRIEYEQGLLCQTEDGQLQLLNRDGSLCWKADVYPWSLEPIVDGRRIYLLCWDTSSSRRWLSEVLPGTLRARVLKRQGKCLVCLNADGRVIWRHVFEIGAQPASAPVFGSDGSVYVVADDGYAYAFEP